jgi:hypothetical protein
MSWYIALNGKQVWIDRDELAYTAPEPPDELPVRVLTYLTVTAKQATYQEHAVDDPADSRTKKSKDKSAGRQRGFIVRVDNPEVNRVLSCFQAAAARLLDSGVVSRVDIDESANGKEKRKKKKASANQDGANPAPPAEDDGSIKPVIDIASLGVNECCIETCARCQHSSHGTGFSVEVVECGTLQRIHCFTAQQQLSTSAWHKAVMEALESAGCQVMFARMMDAPPDAGGSAAQGCVGSKALPSKMDRAQVDEDDWFESVMGRCMVAPKPPPVRGAKGAALDDDGAIRDEADAEDPAAAPASASKAPKALPPWLKTKKKS